ncbi:MAG TPA: hypothetical protein VHX38_24370 [Pseudonocardiaceae bacterium]|jgi:hypothetical protein|nr:hypothetical protein [Pseudonocardiaceae bacterium]
MAHITDPVGGAGAMPNVAAIVRLTTTELISGAIKPVTVIGPDGAVRVVQVRIPPGAADGCLLRVPSATGLSGDDLYVRVRRQLGPTDPTGYRSSTSPRPGQSRRRKRLLAGVLTAAVIGVVIGLVVANQGSGPAENTSAPIATESTQPTTTTPPPESAADYQQALTALATALNTGLAALNNAQTPQAIATATTDLTTALQQAAPAFDVRAPANAQTANAALVTALQDLTGTDLGSISDAANNEQVCLGPAATALLSRTTSLAQLRTAIAGLTTDATYQFGAALPAVTQDGSRSAATGSIVTGGVHHGLGQLTITNGGSTDATVGLVRDQGDAPMVTVYVGQGATYILDHVPDGTYQIYVTSGDDWDSGARLFSRDCLFQQFDDTMDFTTTSSEYTTYTITLTPVLDGNATESTVDPGSFPH